MRELSACTEEQLRQVRYVLTDVDDTITSEGRLLPEALQALWDLHAAGYLIIPVTGGSSGWADTYLRQWPIDAVITESGALAFYMENGSKKSLYHPSIVHDGYQERADRFIETVCSQVPNCKLSSDQFCRIFDIAFDHHGEQPFMSSEEIEQVLQICREQGVSYGVSSIHINCWFGEYDKRSMVELFMQKRYDIDPEGLKTRAVYCGDSSNDIPLFRSFPLSFGVGSLQSVDWPAADLPSFHASKAGGAGFAEIAQLLVKSRNAC